jgi:hypothetical protein
MKEPFGQECLASGVTSVSLLVSQDDFLDPVVSRSVLSARTAGLTLLCSDTNEVKSWTLVIFDGHPANPSTKRPHEYYCEVQPPQTADKCVAEAEQALRSYFGVGGWVKDASPLPGFVRTWSRRAI